MTVTTINIYTGRITDREVIAINKKSIDVSYPEYRTGKQRFYLRPSIGNDYFFAEYPADYLRYTRANSAKG